MQENILFLSHIKLHAKNYAIALGIKVYAKFLNCSAFKYVGLFSAEQNKCSTFYYTSVYFKRQSDFSTLLLSMQWENLMKKTGKIHAKFITLQCQKLNELISTTLLTLKSTFVSFFPPHQSSWLHHLHLFEWTFSLGHVSQKNKFYHTQLYKSR